MITGKLTKPPARPKAVAKAQSLPAAATDVRFHQDQFTIFLSDGRKVSIPLAFYPTLHRATPAKRSAWQLIGRGRGISWESLDLDLSVEGLIAGAREAIPKPPLSTKPKRSNPRREPTRGSAE